MTSFDNVYSIEGNKVIFSDQILTFDYVVGDYLEVLGMLVVRLDLPYKVVYNENVFGISLKTGRVEWRIAKRDYPEINCAYHSIRIFNNQLELINWCSFYVHVNPLTGDILEAGFAK